MPLRMRRKLTEISRVATLLGNWCYLRGTGVETKRGRVGTRNESRYRDDPATTDQFTTITPKVGI